MASTVIPTPAVRPAPGPRGPDVRGGDVRGGDLRGADTRTPAGGLPVARAADPDECGTLLAITVDDRGRSAVLRVRGEIDMLTATDLRAALDEWLTSGAGTLVIDLRDVWFVDCAGIALLVEARRRAGRAGIRLRIVAGRAVARTAALLDLAAALGLTAP
jgi:anti-sigma B factor antagonist